MRRKKAEHTQRDTHTLPGEHHASTQTLRDGSCGKMTGTAGGAVMMLSQGKECLGFQN